MSNPLYSQGEKLERGKDFKIQVVHLYKVNKVPTVTLNSGHKLRKY